MKSKVHRGKDAERIAVVIVWDLNGRSRRFYFDQRDEEVRRKIDTRHYSDSALYSRAVGYPRTG